MACKQAGGQAVGILDTDIVWFGILLAETEEKCSQLASILYTAARKALICYTLTSKSVCLSQYTRAKICSERR